MSDKRLKLFIDASVFIAASASKEGGSAALFKICQKTPKNAPSASSGQAEKVEAVAETVKAEEKKV